MDGWTDIPTDKVSTTEPLPTLSGRALKNLPILKQISVAFYLPVRGTHKIKNMCCSLTQLVQNLPENTKYVLAVFVFKYFLSFFR